MDKSSVTMTDGPDWWIMRRAIDGSQRYPDRIRVGEHGGPRVYVPERTCGFPVVEDEEEIAERERKASEGRIFSAQDVPLCCKCTSCGFQIAPMAHLPEWIRYCPRCGARVEVER